MSVNIDINHSERVLAVEPGRPLRDVLSDRGIYLPSSCGGRAICGMCKVKVLSGGGALTAGEQRLLSEPEKAEGVRLSCQVLTDADLALEIPAKLFLAKKYRTVVTACRALTHDTREVRLRLAPQDRMAFRAGQFAQLVIPPHGDVKTETIRAYSIATPPSEAGELEFDIRLVPKGIASGYVNTRLKEGDELPIIGPMGDFGLHEGDADMICIAGGSGMAPMKSILLDMRERNIAKRSVWFFFGAVTKADLFYVELFRDLEKSWPIFRFVPALSAPAPGDGWTGETGLITDVVDRYLKTKIDAAMPKTGYLCGSPGMLNAALRMFASNGVSADKVYFDKFV